ncbi:MAG: hypothetical protein K8H86_04845, partial [Ignavibacteriaceae bacterium]|nr:hypothetical protein [Ignavibacteriaceae bacterium]
MKKIFEIAKWEFIEKIKTKAFIISIILTPVIIIGFSIGPTLLSEHETETTQAIGVLDTGETYFNLLRNELEKYTLEDGQPNYLIINLYKKQTSPDALKLHADSLVIKNKLEGYLLISNSDDSINFQFRGKSVGNFKELKRFEESFNKVRTNLKLTRSGISGEIINYINKKVELDAIKIDESGKES